MLVLFYCILNTIAFNKVDIDGIWTVLAGVVVELLAKEDKDVVEETTREIGQSCDDDDTEMIKSWWYFR